MELNEFEFPILEGQRLYVRKDFISLGLVAYVKLFNLIQRH